LTSTSLHGHHAVMLRYLLLPLLLQLCQTADPFVVEFDVTLGSKDTGKFQLEVHPDWAPLGAARFKEMVEAEFFKGVRFFRVISGFMAQFGIHPKPTIAAEWKGKALTDDPVVESNKRGYISFATSGKDSRTTQMFINFADNANLDGMGFSPFGKVLGDGMQIVDKIYAGHGETPNQGEIQSRGNAYLKRSFPKLSYINSVKFVGTKEDL